MFTVLNTSWMSFIWTIGFYIFILPIISQSDATSPSCPSETLTSRTGNISSPTDVFSPFCKYWSIRADVGEVVTISFKVLNIQADSDGGCGLNYIQFGPMPMSKFCGDRNHTYIARVKRDHVWMQFNTTDPAHNHFQLRYIVGYVPSAVGCPGLYETDCHNGKCIPEEWICNGYYECEDNSDEAYCEPTTKATNPKGCGWKWTCDNGNCVPWPHKCNGIDNCGDYSDEANCPGRCGPSYLNKTYGSFSSPGYPGLYPNNMDCSWTIVAGYRNKVQLRFNHFRLQDGQNTDSVTVYDGLLYDGSLVGVYYGSHPPPELIESSKDKLFVRFHSDGRYPAQGFTATYQRKDHRTTTSPSFSTGCGPSYLNKTYGSFSSPGYPGLYPNNMDCSWTIVAGYRNKVQLRFNHFRLQDGQNTDSVTVYDGLLYDGSLVGVYYGSHPPPELIESSKDKLFVRFHSDGRYPAQGFTATYQRKGECMPFQKRCKGETECYYDSQRCDGVWNCPEHGSDEKGCGRCGVAEYSCGPTSKCYAEAHRCNGKSFCLNNADENNCTSKRCGPHNGLFLCRNKRCIYESWECDRTSDCEDHSDEEGCPSPFFTRRVIVAAVAGSLICSLLLVIALGCICKVYALRMHEQYGPRHESPLSRLQAEIFRRRAPPPPYHEAMLTSRPYEEVRRESMNPSREHRRRRTNDRRRNRVFPATPEEPSMHQAGTAASGGDLELGSDNDVQLLSLNSTNTQSANMNSSSTAELIPPATSSDSEEDNNQACDDDDDDDDDSDSVLLDLTEGDGGTATWRSISHHTSDEENSPRHVPSDGGCDSLDSASAIISVDDMSLALHETLDKENGVEAEIVDKDNSVDQEFLATSQSSISPSLPEEHLITTEHLIKNQ